MSLDRWRRIEAIFDAARARPQADRDAYVTHACAGDESLRSEIMSLLEQPSAAFLDGAVGDLAAFDGALYVSELTGAPFADGAAQMYRVVEGSAPTVFLAGFKTIIDFTFGPEGSVYVLQHATGPVFFGGAGQIVRVDSNGTRTVIVSGLVRPTSLLVDTAGTIYVTNHGIEVGTGEVLRIEL